MGSLNGDIMVMRNGRSTSQVSVYNYPEHLNPFYEDDQHKRLRFWKISKKDSEGRRNSFSIGNLKDMWAFKTFRMKKKSSTLGINKTSESPPLLRRDYVLDTNWNTFDNRLRASNASSTNSDNFQRNATYRSSLQTLPVNNDRIGLNRNDGYRSTIQVPRSNPRFHPQQQQQRTPGVSQNRRSSQSSLASTNPFERDDEENEDINASGLSSVMNGSTTTLSSRTPRKKRRAPAPPTPGHERSSGGSSPPIIRIEPSQEDVRDELRIEEDIDIANLTAEIESFVKTKSNGDVDMGQKGEDQTVVERSVAKSLDNKEKVQEIATAQRESSDNAVNVQDIDTLAIKEEKLNVAAKVNGQVTTVAAEAKTSAVSATNEEEINAAQMSSKLDESNEIMANGAIPKKHGNSSIVANSSVAHQPQQQSTALAAELCIKETHAEDLPQKPAPIKCQENPEAEFGHIECVHVHVESPKATPRKNHSNGLSSFKPAEAAESVETITNKTPFTLTSPPIQRRNRWQPENDPNTDPVYMETAKIVAATTIKKQGQELNIKEERINAKPEILVKPTLSPKPVTKEPNGKIHGFAEIHKPLRRNNQNGFIRKGSREGSISPPFVPQLQTEKQINSTLDSQAYGMNKLQLEDVEPTIKSRATNNLKIIENTPSVNTTEVLKLVEDQQLKEIKENNCDSTRAIELKKGHDEFDLLYRPKAASYMEWKRSTLAPLETNIPPEKRKSVKDIIESINRSQRLLNAAANKDFTALQNQNQNATLKMMTTCTKNSNDVNANINIYDDTQKEINGEQTAEATSSSAPSPSPSNCNNEYAEAQKFENEIFQKCKVKKEVYDYRESSPISSNLDWNPVPKPKRTKPGHD